MFHDTSHHIKSITTANPNQQYIAGVIVIMFDAMTTINTNVASLIMLLPPWFWSIAFAIVFKFTFKFHPDLHRVKYLTS